MEYESTDGGYGDIPTRPMRVKILYSFDSDNKTNCLARFPNTLQIPAVSIDDSFQVGVIELRKCLETIVAASPELLSRLSTGDFTIYAFDYSEHETPLVGQGMLSTALSQPSSAQGTEKPMITGRVCQNMPAIFNNGVKETLEVKLRMVPVPKANQAPHRNVDSRGVSPAMSMGFDPNAWNTSMTQHRSQLGVDAFNFDPSSSTGDALMDQFLGVGSGVSGSVSASASVGHHMGDVGAAQTLTESSSVLNPAFAADCHSAPGSRSGSPMMVSDSIMQNSQLRHQSFSCQSQSFADISRPVSRASLQNEVPIPNNRRPASPSSFPDRRSGHSQADTFYNEDDQPRKRAKVTQADWRGKGPFGSKSADLRVTAATAASMHMHRPIAKKSAASGSDLDPPPRVPTPVPQRSVLLPNQRPLQPAPARSMLRQSSVAESEIGSDYDIYSDAIVSSPDDQSPGNSIAVDGTPQEYPSSPPVFPGMNLPTPSSPCLPGFPSSKFDSGYMSERPFSSNALDSEGYMGLEPVARRNQRQLSQAYVKVEGDDGEMGLPFVPMTVRLETPGDMDQLPQRMRLDVPLHRQRQASQGPRQSKPSASRKVSKVDTVPATPLNDVTTPMAEAPPSRRGSLALPPCPPSQHSQQSTKRPSRKPLKRHGTFADSEAGSPAPSDNEGGGRPRGPRRSGSGAPRSVLIKEKLERAISKGETPQYCIHCGAIETSTWRKLWVKYVDGKPSPLDAVEGEGETIGIEDLDVDEEGIVTRFVVRKSMKRTKEFRPGIGFKDVVVCNPCGLWFSKFRYMRPSDRWNKKSVPRRKKTVTDPSAMSTDGPEAQSEAFDGERLEREDETAEFTIDDADEINEKAPGTADPSACRPRKRARSLEGEPRRNSSSDSSLGGVVADRQIQSSPVRIGSQNSPIEVEDVTPKPTRRLLFPSPRRDGEIKRLDDGGRTPATFASNPTHLKKPSLTNKADIVPMDCDVNIFEAFTIEKENLPQPGDDGDEFGGLFDGPSIVFKTPSKKTPKSTFTPRSHRQLDHLLKTPTPASRKTGALSPNLSGVNGVANDFMTSPTNTRYFLRSTPSRRDRTPSQRGSTHAALGGEPLSEISPFSRHLAAMLSDAHDSGVYTSPTRGFDFTDLPTYSTPGRNMDWSNIDDILSSEFAAFDGSGGTTGSEKQ